MFNNEKICPECKPEEEILEEIDKETGELDDVETDES